MSKQERDFFDGAKFYTCTDPETLTHTTPWAAIAEELDAMDGDAPGTLRSLIESRECITVWGYAPMVVPASDATGLSRYLADHIAQFFSEQTYGFEDEGAEHNGFPEAVLVEIAAELEPTVLNALRRGRTACAEVGTRVFTHEQVEALMREHHPEWFT